MTTPTLSATNSRSVAVRTAFGRMFSLLEPRRWGSFARPSARLDGVHLHAGGKLVHVVTPDQVGQTVEEFRRVRGPAAGRPFDDGQPALSRRLATRLLVLDLGIDAEVRAGVEDLGVGKARVE